MGYGVAKSYRGKGYATILLEKALDELKTLNVEVVLMTCNPLNFASQTVMKKCGGYQIESYIKKMVNLFIDIIYLIQNNHDY